MDSLQEVTTAKPRGNVVWLLVISALAVIGALLGLHGFAEHRREVRLLEERLMAQARVVDENLNANLFSVSLVLENIIQEIGNTHGSHPDTLNEYLKMQDALSPGIRTILITDSQGRCVNSNREALVGQDLSKRDYFTTPRDASDKSLLFMSPPFTTVLGTFVVNITKPIVGEQGEFKGVISVSLEPDYFLTLLKATIYAPDNRIGLLHSDGTVYVAIPDGTNSIIGQNLMKSGSLFFRHAQGGAQASIQSGRSATTGDNRTFAYISNAPKELRFDKHFVVAASRNTNEALLPWRIEAGIQLSLYLLFSVVVIFVTTYMSRRGDELARLHATQASILDSVHSNIAVLDKNGVIMSVNKAWKNFAADNRAADGELPCHANVGTNYLVVCRDSSGMNSSEAKDALDGISSVLNDSAKLFTLEYPCHSPEVRRWFFMTVEPQQTREGGAVVTHTDITRQKLVEMSLREKTAELDRFFSLALDMLCIADIHGNFRRLNPSWKTTLGYSLEELEGHRFLDLVHPDDQQKTLSAMKDLSSGKPVLNFENRYRCKDGSYRWIEWRSSPYEGELIYAAARDITERKNAEEELARLNERFELAAQSAGIGVWDWDIQLNRLVWDGRMYQLYGLTAGDFGGAYDAWVRGVHPDDRERGDEEIKKALAGEKEFDLEFRVVWPNGQVRHLKAHSKLIRGATGTPVRMIGVNYDITERTRVEKDLLRAKEAAESAARVKSEFLANMSHEIRTPLNAIIGFSEVLTGLISDPKLQGYLSSIQGSGKTLLTLISDILDLSKIEAGRMEIQYIPVDPRILVREIVSIFKPKCDERGVGLELKIPLELPVGLMLDEVRLRQVLFNLVGNAVKFTPRGTITLGMAARRGAPPKAASVVEFIFYVRDTGIGIPGDQLDVIFNAFQQQRGQLHAQYGGTGLGLTISRRLVRMMGGRLEVTSEVGVGSEFRVILPEVDVAAPATSAADASPRNFGFAFRGRQLLIADDVGHNRDLLKAMLDVPGITVTETANGAELLDAVARSRPDLILLDIRMPVLDGYETARRLKSSAHSRDIPIIAITASVQDDAEKSALAAGCDAFLRKPISLSQLLSLVAHMLGDETASPPPTSSSPKPPPLRIRADVPPLREVLRQEILPQCVYLQSKIFVGRVRDVAVRATTLADEHHDEALAAWARELALAAEAFDAAGMKRALSGLMNLMPDTDDTPAPPKGG